MTDESNDQQKPANEKPEKGVSFWLGVAAFIACLYYLLERNQEIPWYVFGLCGALMGFGELIIQIAKVRKP